WIATIVTTFAALVVWSAPPIRARRDEAAPGAGPGGGPVDGAVDPSQPFGIDVQKFIASPPIPGRATKAEVDAAIEKGRAAFLHLYVEPALANAEPGGFVEAVDPKGVKQRLGPDVYVQCQLYLIVHLLMYQEELGLSRDDPLVQRSLKFLLKTF